MTESALSHKDLFAAHNAAIETVQHKKELVKQLELEIKEFDKKYEDAIPVESNAIEIKWPAFLDYVSSKAGMKAWRFVGRGMIVDNRWYCKCPGCTNGGQRKLGDGYIYININFQLSRIHGGYVVNA